MLFSNLHRAFDRGLITINSEYRVKVSRHFEEDASTYGIRRFDGQPILLPQRREYFPAFENFVWDREKMFLG